MAEYQKVAAQWRNRDQTTAAEIPAPRYGSKPTLVRSASARAAPKGSPATPSAPLHAAAEQGNVLEISRLLKIPAAAAHINSFDAKGWTALHYAAATAAEKPLPGHFKAVAMFLNAGADPTITTRNTHCSMLHLIVKASLQQYDTQATSLLTSVLLMVLEKGLKIDLCNGKGKTALRTTWLMHVVSLISADIATSRGSVVTMALLLQHRADPNLPTRKKDTALHIAVKRRDVEKVRILTNYKADTEALNAEGVSPWDMAAKDNLLVLARVMEAAKMRAQQRKQEMEREQAAMNEVAMRWREDSDAAAEEITAETPGEGGGLDDLVATLTEPSAVQEIEAALGPAPDDPVAYQQYMQQKYEFEQKAKEEAAELRRVQTRLLVPSNYHQGAELQKHLAAMSSEGAKASPASPAVKTGTATLTRGSKDRPAQNSNSVPSSPASSSPTASSGLRDSGSGDSPSSSSSSSSSTSGKGIYATIKGMLSRPSRAKLPRPEEFAVVNVAEPDPVDVVEEDAPDLKFYIDGETKRSSVRAATADKLVGRLTGSRDPGQHYVDSFLLCFRRFFTPRELLTKLSARYSTPEATEDAPLVQLRVLSALRQWLEHHCTDFLEDEALKASLFEFLDNRVLKTPSHKGSAAQLKKVFERQQVAEEKKKADKEREKAEAAAAAAAPVAAVNMLEQDVAQLAKQITLLEADLYFQIQPRECLNMNWSKNEHLSPNLLRFTRHFNEMSAWVVSEVVNQVQLKIRSALLSKFIQLAHEFRKLHNFTGVMEIISGLGNSSVKRLSKTWEGVEGPLMETYRNLSREMSFEKNFKIYRELLKTVGTPCLPYFGMYLTDLTFIEEGNPDTIDGGLINFYKCERVAEVIKSIQFYQDLRHRSQYDTVARVPAVLQAFRTLKPLTEKEAYALSQRVEPRNQDEALEHLLVEEQRLRQQVQELQLQKAQADAVITQLQATVAYLTHRLKVATADLRLSRDISALAALANLGPGASPFADLGPPSPSQSHATPLQLQTSPTQLHTAPSPSLAVVTVPPPRPVPTAEVQAPVKPSPTVLSPRQVPAPALPPPAAVNLSSSPPSANARSTLSPPRAAATPPSNGLTSPPRATTRKNFMPERFSQVHPPPVEPPPPPPRVPEIEISPRPASGQLMRKPLPPVPRARVDGEMSPRPASERQEKSPSRTLAASSSPPDELQRSKTVRGMTTPATVITPPQNQPTALFFPEVEDELKRISAFRSAEENGAAATATP